MNIFSKICISRSKSVKILLSTIFFSTFTIIQPASAAKIILENHYKIEVDNQSSGDIMVQPRDFLCVQEESDAQTIPKGKKTTITVISNQAITKSENCNTSSAKFNLGLAQNGKLMGDLIFISTAQDSQNKSPKDALVKHKAIFNPSQIKQDKQGGFAVAGAINTLYVDVTKDENTISEEWKEESGGTSYSPDSPLGKVIQHGNMEYHAHIVVH